MIKIYQVEYTEPYGETDISLELFTDRETAIMYAKSYVKYEIDNKYLTDEVDIQELDGGYFTSVVRKKGFENGYIFAIEVHEKKVYDNLIEVING